MSLESIEREHVRRCVTPKQRYGLVPAPAPPPPTLPRLPPARVVSTDGNKTRVEFRARVVVEVRYVIEVVQDPEKFTTSWTFVEGEVVSDSVGGWTFTAEGANDTKIKYRAGIAIRAPLPKFVINKVANALMGTSIPNMFRAVEREAAARLSYQQK